MVNVRTKQVPVPEHNPEIQFNGLEVKEFTIGSLHTIPTGNYQSLRVEVSITCAVKSRCSKAEFDVILDAAKQRLRHIVLEAYESQREQHQELLKYMA